MWQIMQFNILLARDPKPDFVKLQRKIYLKIFKRETLPLASKVTKYTVQNHVVKVPK